MRFLMKSVYGYVNLPKRKVAQNKSIYDNGEEKCVQKLGFIVDLKPDTQLVHPEDSNIALKT